MIFTAYLDESGTHDNSLAVSVAGYISTPDAWERFDDEWRAALSDFGVSMWHMADFESGLGEFEGWTEPLRRERLSRLVRIINAHAIASFGNTVLRPECEATMRPEAHRFMGGPYGLNALSMMMALGDVLSLTGASGSIAYVFESGAAGYGEVLKMFTENERNPRQKALMRLLSLRFENKREFTPLQAADILAYELYKHAPRQYGLEEWSRGPRHPLRMLANIPHDWGHLDAGEIEKFSRIVTLRTMLRPDELEPPSPANAYSGPVVPISVKDFQDRWRWYLRFKGRRQREKVEV